MIYRGGIWDDLEAVDALCAEGNQNADVEMREDEMTIFGVVHTYVRRLATKSVPDQIPDASAASIGFPQISAYIKKTRGLGKFNEREWEAMFALRNSLPDAIAEVMIKTQWTIAAGRSRVRATNFKYVANLEKNAPWV